MNGQNVNTNVGRGERIASALGGGVLAYYALRRRNWAALPLSVAGAAFVTRGATGHSRVYERMHINTSQPQPLEFVRSVTVNRPPAEVYRFWRQLKNLPRFMRHLESVAEIDERRSHWTARTPITGQRVEWDAEILEDRPDDIIRWRSLAGSDLDNEGRVLFAPAPGGRGTEVHVTLRYKPASGAGAAIARLLAGISEQYLKEEIRRFKSVIEAGEAPTIEGQSSGRRAA